jgi:structural maintenance of chromosome 2
VGYPDEVEKAMSYVFGDTFVCDDAEIAKLVTFSPEVKGARSVTLAGDVYDPSGTLSGGSAPSSSGILIKVQDLLDVERQLGEAQGKVNLLLQEEERTREQRDKWRSLVKELDIKEHSMKLLEEQVGGSNATRVSFSSPSMYGIVTELTAWHGHRQSEEDHS